MEINDKTIEKLAELSKINIDNSKPYKESLSEVIEFMTKLEQFDDNIVVEQQDNPDIYREDVVKPSLDKPKTYTTPNVL